MSFFFIALGNTRRREKHDTFRLWCPSTLDVVTQLKNTETAASRSGSPELNPPGAAARLLIRMPSYSYSSALDAVQQHGRKIRRATHLIDRRERQQEPCSSIIYTPRPLK